MNPDVVDAFSKEGKNREIVDCGEGADDTVYFDRGRDTVKNCENKVPTEFALP